MIATNYVIILNHIGPDAMHYLLDRINAIEGVLSLLPCKSVNEDGKYKVLVYQKNYHNVCEYLKMTIPEWYREYVEPDAKAPPERYPGNPEVSRTDSDGFSQGDQSYMTISVGQARLYQMIVHRLMYTRERKMYQQIHQRWEKAEQTCQVMQERGQTY